MIEAVGANGRSLHPTLHRLYSELDSSAHAVRILIPDTRGSSAIAGRFRIDAFGTEGRHETTILLNVRTIDRVLTGSPDAQVGVQRRSLELARRAQTEGVSGEGFAEAVQENDRRARSLEEPALAAEAAITEELRACR